MGRTALIVAVQEAEAQVSPTRRLHDWSAARGVPAHVTVLFPFAEGGDVDEDALGELFAAHAAFDFVLDRVERWDSGIVWLHPEPSRPFEELTRAVWRRWPDHPPYEGAFDAVIPHLTVSETPIELEVDLPIASRAVEVTLIEEQSDGTWANRRTFPLADR
jgi:2'-5' RNA ligase superfamily